MRICFWGTYDTGKPRIRILLTGLKQSGSTVTERHVNLWKNLSDKSQIKSFWLISRLLLTAVSAYPYLLARHAFSRRNDVVLCGYPGYLDILVLWPLTKLRGERLALDAFIPLYDTVVMDRKLAKPQGLLARLLHFLEGMSCRCADTVIVDTHAHGKYFAIEYAVKPDRIVRAFVGCEPEFFFRTKKTHAAKADAQPIALFYGQFIPLHGIGTIVEAAMLCEDKNILWRIIGTGQEAPRITEMLRDAPLPNLQWIPWVEYETLRSEIEQATVCLGIFGTSMKAARVIPNKVFQIVACGKPIITRDSPAIRELFMTPYIGLHLVPPGDPAALSQAVLHAIGSKADTRYDSDLLKSVLPGSIGNGLIQQLKASCHA